MTPPQGELFAMFHGKSKVASPPPPPPHNAYPQWYPPPMPPLGYGLPGFPGYPHAAVAPPLPPTPVMHHPMLSSDPADDSGPSYPSIIDFIESLIAKVPQRQALREIGETLDSLHFFDINEITHLTASDFGTEKFGNIVLGDAQYLLTQVGKEVKRLDKAARRARHP